MRRATGLAVMLAVALGLPSACGIDPIGSAPAAADAGGGAGTDGGQTINSGTCFPGAKACPDDKGDLTCVSGDDPASGCLVSTGCAPCIVPKATAKCSIKGCDVGACDAGWSDCNQDAVDGCETSLDKDPSNCGACGTDCFVTSGPGYTCQAGKCVPNDCQPQTTANCDLDPTNGCEVDLIADVNNCSFCGKKCQLAHATAGCEPNPTGNPVARCFVKQCDAGWADCDGNPANGCESNASTDPSTCGGCGKKCNSTNGVAGCVNGVCDLLCNSGFGNCDNNKDNGCETDLNSHVLNCGACGQACPSQNGSPVCVGGKCSTGGCSTGYADCDGNTANGCETLTTNDPGNCGGCGKVCATTPNGFPTCTNGGCGVGCSAGFATCGTGTTCFDTTTDVLHCGAGCKTCPGPTSGTGTPSCAGGACGITCAAGLSTCGTACLDLKTDVANCGACGKVCTAAQGGTPSCSNGVCAAVCPTGVAVCANQCVDVYTDNGNCGQCGKTCGLGQQCSGGNCVCKYGGKNCGSYCAQCCTKQDCGGGKWCCLGFCC
ncbi:MAG: hypothetical protein IPI67_03635 [Myxococcales bacterium]|nr:hypothetical protein [Myxococcales bacterium]